MTPGQLICPLCQDKVDKLVYRFHFDSERAVIEKIRNEFPEWTKEDGLCSRCLDFFHSEIVMQQRLLPSIGPHFPIKTADDFIVIPTGLRINADPRFTGKGVTICLIDSGFCAHPDLVATKNRIKCIVDIAETTEASPDAIWHGTMTSVVCAGDGFLSKGLYKSVASEAELVLLKTQDQYGKITTANILRALSWVLENHEVYNIRIVNISLSADENQSYLESKVDLLAEMLIEIGIVVVAAVGNDINSNIKPPANAINVITVGGLDDQNNLESFYNRLYHSSFGRTIDNLMKPELIAHAMWIAAPILPGTAEQKEAESLYRMVEMDDETLAKELTPGSNDLKLIRENILLRIRQCKYISPNYMHVDGTSFAAPIVSSVIAQLIEINPKLTPQEIRQLILSTAKRMDDVPERQGFGIIQPRKAVLKTLKSIPALKRIPSPHINHDTQTIGFYIQHECASQITVAGSFNDWAKDVFYMEPGNHGVWRLQIPMLPDGHYQYKFLVDEKIWIEDSDNPYREPDGFNGFNSILTIKSN